MSFPTKSGSLNPILKPVFLYLWPLTQNWISRGQGFLTPNKKYLLIAKPYCVGCPFPTKSMSLNPILETSFTRLCGPPDPKLEIQELRVPESKQKNLLFGKPYPCWVSFPTKSGSLNPILKPVFLYLWPWPKNRYPGFNSSWSQKLLLPNHIVLGLLSWQIEVAYSHSNTSFDVRLDEHSRSFDFHPLLRRLVKIGQEMTELWSFKKVVWGQRMERPG